MICLVSWYFRTAKETQLHPSKLWGLLLLLLMCFWSRLLAAKTTEKC